MNLQIKFGIELIALHGKYRNATFAGYLNFERLLNFAEALISLRSPLLFIRLYCRNANLRPLTLHRVNNRLKNLSFLLPYSFYILLYFIFRFSLCGTRGVENTFYLPNDFFVLNTFFDFLSQQLLRSSGAFLRIDSKPSVS